MENSLLAHAKEHENSFEVVIMRPGLFLNKFPNIGDVAKGFASSVRIDVLARAIIICATQGSKTQLVENGEIVLMGS